MQKYKSNDTSRKETKVEEILESACAKLKTMVDTSVIVGDKITFGDVSIIPLSKVSVGFVAGGGEYDKNPGDKDFPFAGGSGAGYTLTPVGYLAIKGSEVSFTKIIPEGPMEKLFDVLPTVVDKINEKIEQKRT